MHQQIHAAANTDPNLSLTLKVLPAVIVILVVAAACGWLATRLWQPRVLGEMVGGVLLGPTLFGWLFPDAQETVFPDEITPSLYLLSTIGLTLYMFLVGAGLDHGGPGGRVSLREPGLLALSGITLPVLLGGAVGWLLWERLSEPGVGRWFFAAFLGGALAVTALPMLARILYERGLENTRLGRLALLGGSFDDGGAWCLLAVLTAVHQDSLGDAVRTLGLTLLFCVVMLTVVSRLLRPLGRHVARTGQLGTGAMYLVVLIGLTGGWLTDWIGVYSVFGGFIAGLAMPRDGAFRRLLHDRMMAAVSTLLLPIFFAFSGLNTRLDGLAGGAMVLAFLAILTAGAVGKYVGCSLVMRGLGYSWRESTAVGALMNARGLMILIFINIGLSQGMIGDEVFAILVLVAVVTTAAAMPLYKLSLPGRLEDEQRAGVERPKVPTAA